MLLVNKASFWTKMTSNEWFLCYKIITFYMKILRLHTLTKSMNSTFWPPESSFKSVGETVIPSATGGGLELGLGPDRRGLPASLRRADGEVSPVRTLSGFSSGSGHCWPLGDSWAGGVLARLKKSAASCERPNTRWTSGGVFFEIKRKQNCHTSNEYHAWNVFIWTKMALVKYWLTLTFRIAEAS